MTDPVDILLVEDNPGDVRLLQEHLADGMKDGFRITHCSRLEQALQRLAEGSFDVVLLDLSLPDSNGLTTFLDVHGRAGDLPIVILSGLDDQAVASQAMQNGAQDYLPKSRLDGRQLARTIRYAIERKQWEESIREREERITSMEKLEAIGRLSGGLAHNFNNILTAVVGNCELLAPLVTADARAARYVDTIAKAAERAATLTRQLMSFCQRQPMAAQPIAPARVLRGLEPMLRGTLGDGVALRLAIDDGAATTLADPSQLEQMVLNLALNARDAVPGGGQIVIGCGGVELATERTGFPHSVPRGAWVRLTVEDDGPGIDAAIRPHIFEPFFTTKDRGKSPGLGLATVHGIVRQSQGFIQVEDRAGGGTVVSVWLPRQDRPPVPLAVAPPPARRSSARGLETVLLVEDEPQICAVLAEALATHGYRILVAANAEEALRLFQRDGESIQVVVSDVDIPGIGGLELAQRLKARRPGVQIIVISGYAQDDLPQTDGLVAAFLPKPFSALTLARTIREVMPSAAA